MFVNASYQQNNQSILLLQRIHPVYQNTWQFNFGHCKVSWEGWNQTLTTDIAIHVVFKSEHNLIQPNSTIA